MRALHFMCFMICVCDTADIEDLVALYSWFDYGYREYTVYKLDPEGYRGKQGEISRLWLMRKYG